MKNIFSIFKLLSIIAIITACEKDAGKLPNIDFKTGLTLISEDTSLTAGTSITIGINASKADDKDVLKKFTVSKSVNGGTATTVYTQDLSGAEGDSYTHEYTETLAGNAGDIIKYTFTVTNRDGLMNQVFLTITIKGMPPHISFKTGPIYISSDISLAATSIIAIGINTSKSETSDGLKKFTVTKSINGAAATTVFTHDLTGAEIDSYNHDYTEVLAGSIGTKIKYTFTITTATGITNQLSITVTVV
ncbi:MAG: hypothetical protein IPP15_16465 [Saprospiraceae bacterium]|uniref:Uncharacterized protein n=1 Tax=Candidatus Opimibacter skivensis TaxID=2982028 RepID=A0A9D7SXS9_9BACT|nr:hypothetical protein [Candidatus Opimibacter skivensis]